MDINLNQLMLQTTKTLLRLNLSPGIKVVNLIP